jgi:hypothetical protein
VGTRPGGGVSGPFRAALIGRTETLNRSRWRRLRVGGAAAIRWPNGDRMAELAAYADWLTARKVSTIAS